ncbi:MAG: penicillin-binding protein 2 [Bacillota bacterium]|jgi:penicillin-binding protein 2
MNDFFDKNKTLKMFTIIIMVLFLILTVRLFTMQVVKAEEYNTLSAQNTIRVISIPASRGDIYDCEMTEMAVSKPVFAVALASSEIKDREVLAENLAALLNDPEITAESIVTTLKEHYRRYEPVVIKRYPYEEGLEMISKLEELRDLLPGVVIQEEPMRYYPLETVAGHVLGTVGMISETELENLSQEGYNITDWIGKSGLEKGMERFTVEDKEIGLRGQNGMQQVEVNANHRIVRTLSNKEPVAGNSLVLTLDSKVQEAMEKSLQETVNNLSKNNPKCQGASAVLIDVKTGGIIAMASYPSMDPNEFASGLSQSRAKYYYDETLRPTFNRAISGAYPPGSTFKIVTAAAILESGVIDPNAYITCNASAWAVLDKAKCPYEHGAVNLQKALAVSCNNYFQEMAAKIGIDQLYETAKAMGFGAVTGLELPSETAGILPNPEWKAQRFKGDEGKWRLYDTHFMAMGQGYNNNTVLQLAAAVGTIANDGDRMQAHLVDQVLSPDGDVLYQAEPVIVDALNISDQNLQILRDAMYSVTQPSGTSYQLFANFPVKVGAKTGTAQTGIAGDDKNRDYHGAFVAFAPYDAPEVAFACLVEYGYHGGSSGGVVCKDVFTEYFGLNKEPESTELPVAPE